MTTFQQLIKEICIENDIKYNLISNDWVILLEKDNKRKVITGYKFDNNTHGLGLTLDDKYATYELLNYLNIPVIEHNILYSKNNKNEYANNYNSFEYLKELFYKYNQNIIIKANKGSGGTKVYHFNNEKSLSEFYNKLTSSKTSYSVCPFYNIENEYRIIILNKKVELIYKKELPKVIGNGKSTLKELLQEFNYEYFKEYNEENKDVVLKLNEEYVHNWKFNLTGGAKASFEISDDTRKILSNIAIDIIKKINLGFCSIDIIKTIDGNYYVMEINSGVMMNNLINETKNGYEIAKKIYIKAILDIFN